MEEYSHFAGACAHNSDLERSSSEMLFSVEDHQQRQNTFPWRRLVRPFCICLEGPLLEKWDSNRAVKLWCTDKTRRVNYQATYTCKSEKQEEEEQEKNGINLDEFETWLPSDDEDEADDEDQAEADGER